MSRLCWSCGARTCCRERFCVWCIPWPAIGGVYRVRRAEASSLRAASLNARLFALLFTRSGTRLALASQHSNRSPMKHLCFAVLLGLTCLALLTSRAQTPVAKPDDQELLTLVKEVQAQQAKIASNQTQIDSKLVDLAEAIRVARIYSSRSR